MTEFLHNSIMTEIEQLLKNVLSIPEHQSLSIELSENQSNHYICYVGYPCALDVFDAQKTCQEAISTIDPTLTIALSFRLPDTFSNKRPDSIKQVIGVASCKGGVGKSTVAMNLAYQLKKEGGRVGVLDADIYGPNQSLLFGFPSTYKAEIKDQKYILPAIIDDIQVMSMDFLTNESSPLVWRGPMATQAVTQLYEKTLWHELDYLIVDFPPGTGDIPLTLCKRVEFSGIVLVTTPQQLAVTEVSKSIQMFEKLEVPVLGWVENMAYFTCLSCEESAPVFFRDTDTISQIDALLSLGQLPMAKEINRLPVQVGQTIDYELPEVFQIAYREIAITVARLLWDRLMSQAPKLEGEVEGKLEVEGDLEVDAHLKAKVETISDKLNAVKFIKIKEKK